MSSTLNHQGHPWPEGKNFAFTIVDDPDSQTFEAGKAVYSLLRDLGLRTTKAVWPISSSRASSDQGITCGDNPDYIDWLLCLQSAGFEIAYHNATSHSSTREETMLGLNQFAKYFGQYPRCMTNHYFCNESMYWGENRFTGLNKLFYSLATLGKNRGGSHGHVSGSPYFWGDMCRDKIKYVRNFVFGDVNTSRSCPSIAYHDIRRPYVNYWFASSEGSDIDRFVDQISEGNQDHLEEEGGACIISTHFGHGFYKNGELSRRFVFLLHRLAKRNGWFVPVSTLLDYALSNNGSPQISDLERLRLECRWLLYKLRVGTARMKVPPKAAAD